MSLFIEDVVKLLGCTKSNVLRLVNNGDLSCDYTVGGGHRRCLFDEDEVLALKEYRDKNRHVEGDGLISKSDSIKMVGCGRNHFEELMRRNPLPYKMFLSEAGRWERYYDISAIKLLRDDYAQLLSNERPEGCVTVKEAADLLGCSTNVIVTRIHDGTLNYVVRRSRRNRRVFFMKKEDILKLEGTFKRYHKDRTIEDVASICGCCTTTIGNFAKRGWIDSVVLEDGRREISDEALFKFLDKTFFRGDWRKDVYLDYKDLWTTYGYSVREVDDLVKSGDLPISARFPNGWVRFLLQDVDKVCRRKTVVNN